MTDGPTSSSPDTVRVVSFAATIVGNRLHVAALRGTRLWNVLLTDTGGVGPRWRS